MDDSTKLSVADCDAVPHSRLRVSRPARSRKQLHLLVSALQLTGSNDNCTRGTAILKNEGLCNSTCLGQVTQMATLQSTGHRVFHDNIPPGLKTLVSPRKPTRPDSQGFLSGVSGASDREA